MEKIMIGVSGILAIILIAVMLPNMFSNNEQSPSPMPTSVNESGKITGSLSFPSETIPENMVVCAKNLQSGEEICTDAHIEGDQFTYGRGYELEVPTGTYEVFAYLPLDPNRKAYYNEFVTCGLSIDCESHEPIPVAVSAGQSVEGVDPQDWYQITEPTITPESSPEVQM